MLFWRAKTAKQAVETKEKSEDGATDVTAELAVDDGGGASAVKGESPVSLATVGQISAATVPDDAQVAADDDGDNDNGDQTSAEVSKVVSITTAGKLIERLAEMRKPPAVPSEGVLKPVDAANDQDVALTAALADGVLSMQTQAVKQLETALSQSGPRAHVLVYGSPGTGRTSAAIDVAHAVAAKRPIGVDFIYAAVSDQHDRLSVFEVPAHTGAAIVRDVRDALTKAAAMLSRHVAGDGHQMSLAMLEEDHRQRSSGGIEQLKRRAEAQNIALVNTSEGFVLAPMHEGRVVRADVFRALPEALQRDVEAKITAFEGELQSLLQALPGTDIATDDRHVALCAQTAERALKPSLAVARKLTAAAKGSEALIDMIETDWLRRASDVVRRGEAKAALPSPSLSVLSPESAQGAGAPVVVARTVGAQDLAGEVGRNADGMIVVRPGALSLAAGGFLIVDAWRLANDPQGYAVLSAALESGEIHPIAAPGLAVRAEAQPLSATVILIGDKTSLEKLKGIDPRIEAHFAEVVRFAETATALNFSQDDFADWAGSIAERGNLKPIAKAGAPILYEDARSRAGDMSRVSLDARTVLATLTVAERRAADAGRAYISADDLKAAVGTRAILRAIEVEV